MTEQEKTICRTLRPYKVSREQFEKDFDTARKKSPFYASTNALQRTGERAWNPPDDDDSGEEENDPNLDETFACLGMECDEPDARTRRFHRANARAALDRHLSSVDADGMPIATPVEGEDDSDNSRPAIGRARAIFIELGNGDGPQTAILSFQR